MTRTVALRDTKLDAIKGVIALHLTGDEEAARDWGNARWGAANAPQSVVRAAVGAFVADDVDSVASNVEDRAFFQSVADLAILPRLRGARRIGFRTRTVTASPATAAFIAEGEAFPIMKPVFSNTGLSPAKIVSATIATREALNTAPRVAAVIRDELVTAYARAWDDALLDPTNDGSGAAPASITNGVTPVTAGVDPAEDVAALVAAFGGDLLASYFIMHPTVAARLSGEPIGRDLGIRGGDLLGAPVIVSRGCPAELVVLVDPSGICGEWDETAILAATRAGTVEMSDEPTQDAITPTAATQQVSLWQTGSVGFRAIGAVAWQAVRSGSVAVLEGGTGSWLE